jgi:hypothetical protein
MTIKKKNLQKQLKSLKKDQEFLRVSRFGSDQSITESEKQNEQKKKRRRRRLYYLLGGAAAATAATGLVLSNKKNLKALNKTAYAVTHPFSDTNDKTFTGNMAQQKEQRQRQQKEREAEQERIKRSGLTSGQYHTSIAKNLQLQRHQHKFKDPSYTPLTPGKFWTTRTARDEMNAYNNYLNLKK